MTQLYINMFDRKNGSQFAGLINGLVRKDDFIHNGGWYNKKGEKLGWGDLSVDDFRKISSNLVGSDLFIILNENAAFWNFVTHNPGFTGAMCTVNPDAESPGFEYVAEKCIYVIAKYRFYFVDRIGDTDGETIKRRGLVFKVLKKDDVKAFIESFTT